MSGNGGAYDFHNLNVLIVDDNKHMRTLIRTVLNALGVWNVHEASDGADALKELEIFPADILICDLMMTPFDGIELTQMIRTAADSPNPFLPIIMLTGHTEMFRVAEARDVGVDEFLAKPISPKTLYGRIAQVIDNRRDFVKAGNYFGPDRRRRDDPNYIGKERRSAGTEGDGAEDGEGGGKDLTPEEIDDLMNS